MLTVYSYVLYITESNSEIMNTNQINNQKTTSFTIRPEAQTDLDTIYDLIRTAFETAHVKDGTEQDFAVKLRESDAYIPELALVAEQDGQLIGHIMFTRMILRKPDGTPFQTLMVAPLSVLLESRNLGVGSALMREGFRLARAMGYTSAFLCGDPEYYKRLDFKPIREFGIKTLGEVPEQYIMACELEPEALNGIGGTVDFC